MNCQTETPAARATTSSWFRVIRVKVTTPADERSKRQRLLGHEGESQQRHLENDVEGRRLVRTRGAAQQLDHVGNQDRRHEDQQDKYDTQQVLLADIERQCRREAHGLVDLPVWS